MASDAIRQRFEGLFQAIDRNGDGFLDVEDYDSIVDVLAQLRSLEPGSPERSVLRGKIMASWDAVQAAGDADGDGRVTRDEWVQCLETLSQSPEGFDQVALAIADQMITAMDADGDGLLNLEEYGRMMSAWGATAERSDEQFRYQDTDGDGFLSREELLAGVRRFFFDDGSDEPHLWRGAS